MSDSLETIGAEMENSRGGAPYSSVSESVGRQENSSATTVSGGPEPEVGEGNNTSSLKAVPVDTEPRDLGGKNNPKYCGAEMALLIVDLLLKIGIIAAFIFLSVYSMQVNIPDTKQIRINTTGEVKVKLIPQFFGLLRRHCTATVEIKVGEGQNDGGDGDGKSICELKHAADTPNSESLTITRDQAVGEDNSPCKFYGYIDSTSAGDEYCILYNQRLESEPPTGVETNVRPGDGESFSRNEVDVKDVPLNPINNGVNQNKKSIRTALIITSFIVLLLVGICSFLVMRRRRSQLSLGRFVTLDHSDEIRAAAANEFETERNKFAYSFEQGNED